MKPPVALAFLYRSPTRVRRRQRLRQASDFFSVRFVVARLPAKGKGADADADGDNKGFNTRVVPVQIHIKSWRRRC